ncbi:MAG: hypothetical protein ACREUG_16160 [Steroidobacteraceae bacterium]
MKQLISNRQDRLRLLKWMLAGGGAAIARFLGGPLAIAAPSAREQAAWPTC